MSLYTVEFAYNAYIWPIWKGCVM